MKSKKSHDPWFIEYENVIQQGKTTSLFCHACKYDDPTTLKSTNHPIPKELGKFSGALFFPDFKLIILSPPTGIVDVLSMGNYTPKPIDLVSNPNAYAVKGAWHCVFSNLFAHQLHEEKLTGIPITSVFHQLSSLLLSQCLMQLLKHVSKSIFTILDFQKLTLQKT